MRDFYIDDIVPRLSSHGCFFDDMARLPEGIGHCAVHGHNCRVQTRTDVHVCGFSCKDLSKLNNCWARAERQHILDKGLGTTGRTFAALTSYAASCKPRTLILENVDDLDDHGKNDNPNLDFLYHIFSSIGYIVGQKT